MDQRQSKCFHGRTISLILLALLGALTGCTRFTDTVPLPPEAIEYALYGTRTIGQMFVCHHAGLNAVSVLLRAPAGAGDLTLHLRQNADDTEDLATVSVSPTPGESYTFHEFVLPLQDDVNGKSFFVLLEAPDATENEPIVVPYYRLDASLQYGLSLGDGAPSPGHVSFQLKYNSLSIVKDLLRQVSSFGLGSLWLLFLSALFYLLPGGAAVAWLLREGEWIDRTIVALGLSVAIYALLMYATMAGLRLNTAVVIGFLVLCGALIAVRWGLDRRSGPFRAVAARDVWMALKGNPSLVVLAWILMLVLGVRIWITRDLVAPMWGDSYQHTMIAQLMVDNGGLFDSWEPYAPLTTLTYHFGFHANVALFHWLSGDSVIHSMIWVGQILNGLAVLALYPLAVRASDGNRWAGVGAVLVAGLLSPMPMYYVNWGRYTQLAGQVVLPVLMWLTWRVTEESRWDWRLTVLAVIALTGLGITHYRVVVLYGVFVVAWGFVTLIRKWGQWRWMGQTGLRLTVIGCIVLLLFLPWGMHMFSALIPQVGKAMIQYGSQHSFLGGEYNAIGDVSGYVPWSLLITSAVAFVWRSYERKSAGWVMVLWAVGLFIVANPYRLNLPGTGLVNNFAVLIMLYIPSGILTGLLLGKVFARLSCCWRGKGKLLVFAAVVLISGWGVILRMKDLAIEHAMVTDADMEAMAWIRSHTAEDARFLVNGFPAYGSSSVVGADAGWWIPLLTGRENTIPPLTYSTEMARDPDYRAKVNGDLSFIEQRSLASSKGIQFIRSRGVTHVYIGRGQGMVGNPGEPLLDIKELSNSPAYSLAYQQRGVWIFALAAPQSMD